MQEKTHKTNNMKHENNNTYNDLELLRVLYASICFWRIRKILKYTHKVLLHFKKNSIVLALSVFFLY